MDVFLHEYDQNILQVPIIYQFIYECFSEDSAFNSNELQSFCW